MKRGKYVEKIIKTRVKILRCIFQDSEMKIQQFLDTLNQNPVQILDIKLYGDFLENHVIAITILYQG